MELTEDVVGIEGGISGMGEFVLIEGGTAYEAVNDDNAYNGDWQISDPESYIDPIAPVEGGEGPSDVSHTSITEGEGTFGDRAVQSQTAPPRPFTRIPSRNGQVGVRLNVPVNFSGSGGIVLGGRISGTFPAGMPVYGSDSRNNNGIPDLLEKCFSARICTFGR